MGTAADPAYNFNYYTGSNTVGDIVPPMFSPYQDHWGYFNGLPQIWNMISFYVPTSADGIPSLINVFYYPYEKIISDPMNYRKVVDKMASNGCIKSIEYPTKGVLPFQYEQNTAVDNNGTPIVVGGVRVNKTTIFDAIDHTKDVVTEYKYNKEDGSTSGWGAGYDPLIYSNITPLRIYKCGSSNVPASLSTYGILNGFSKVVESVYAAGNSTIQIIGAVGSYVAAIAAEIIINRLIYLFQADWKDYTLTEKFINPVNSNVVMPLQYSRVQVSAISATGNNGKIIYEFTSKDNFGLNRPNMPFPYSDEQRYCYWFSGLPKVISIFDNNNQLVNKTVNEYNYNSNNYLNQNFVSQKWSPSMKNFDCASKISSWELTSTNLNIAHSLYYPYFGRTELTETKEYTYKNNVAIINSSTKYCYSPGNYQVKQVLSSNSKNEQLETNVYYPFDYNNIPDLQTLIDKNMVIAPVSS